MDGRQLGNLEKWREPWRQDVPGEERVGGPLGHLHSTQKTPEALSDQPDRMSPWDLSQPPACHPSTYSGVAWTQGPVAWALLHQGWSDPGAALLWPANHPSEASTDIQCGTIPECRGSRMVPEWGVSMEVVLKLHL